MRVSVDNAGAPGSITLEEDVPCKRCAYDLRGLKPPGRCPECGHDLDVSLQAHALRVGRFAPPDPAWARQVREGAWLGIVAFGLVLVTAFVPETKYCTYFSDAPPWETPLRTTLLATGCASWVLAWASAWKLTVPEPSPHHTTANRFSAIAARRLATAYLVLPVTWAVAERPYVWWAASPWVWLLVICGMATGFTLLVRVGLLLRRRGYRVMVLEAWVLAAAIPFSVFFLLSSPGPGRGDGPDSLTMIFFLPLYPYGFPGYYGDIVAWLPEARFVSPFELILWVYLLLPLWSLSLLIRLIVAYRPSALRPAAGPGRRSEPSSPP